MLPLVLVSFIGPGAALRKKLQQILAAQRSGGDALAGEDVIRKLLLALLHLHDFFLNRAFYDQLIDITFV